MLIRRHQKPNPELEAELKTPIIVVDFADVESLTRVLEDNNIHTVVSAINMLHLVHLGGHGPREIELIRAADASKTTKRMISSDWGPPHIKEYDLPPRPPLFLGAFNANMTRRHESQLASVGPKFLAKEELKKVTDLETTYVQHGFFLDYYGLPNIRSHMAPALMILDIPNDAAAIPGSGNTAVMFPHTTDVAKFVTLMLDLDKWDSVTYVEGDRVTWNEFVHLAEEAKGERHPLLPTLRPGAVANYVPGTKFNVKYDSVESLEKGETTELPGQLAIYPFFPKEALQGMAATFGLWFEQGVLGFMPEKSLNEQFPEVTTWKVKDFLQEAWGKHQ